MEGGGLFLLGRISWQGVVFAQIRYVGPMLNSLWEFSFVFFRQFSWYFLEPWHLVSGVDRRSLILASLDTPKIFYVHTRMVSLFCFFVRK